ncbi:MAG: dynamin family protein, partial [Candidatus Poribacteria bacterium]
SQKLFENHFNLVVMGQFKRGKTTFINALLGQDLLPTAIIPLTSVITIIKYGEHLKIRIFFDNNATKDIQLDELPLYVTEKHNPKNKKGVRYAEIFYPSPYLQNGVQIVDTPGIASIHEHNTEITYQYLPNADAAIFLVSVDPPITQAEFDFLNDLKKDISKIFFVLNKIDIANDQDWKESLKYTKKIIEKEVGLNDITIFPLSARDALLGKIQNDQKKLNESGLLSFESTLEEFLMTEKGNVLLNTAINRTLTVISQEALFTQLMQKSLHTPLNELEEKRKALADMFTKVNRDRIDNEYLLNGEVQTLIREVLEADLEKLKREKTKWLIDDIKKVYKAYRNSSNREFARSLDNYLTLQIKDIFNQWRSREDKIIRANLEKILQRFTLRVNEITEHVLKFSSELFDVPVDVLVSKESLSIETGFWFRLYEPLDTLSTTIDFITNMLPKGISHNLIFRKICKRAEILVDQHCGRLRYDFINRIEKTVKDYKNALNESADIIIKNIDSLLQSAQDAKQKTTEEVTKLEKEVNEKIQELIKISQYLSNLQQTLLTCV